MLCQVEQPANAATIVNAVMLLAMSDDFMESSMVCHDAQPNLQPQAEESTDGCQRSHDRSSLRYARDATKQSAAHLKSISRLPKIT